MLAYHIIRDYKWTHRRPDASREGRDRHGRGPRHRPRDRRAAGLGGRRGRRVAARRRRGRGARASRSPPKGSSSRSSPPTCATRAMASGSSTATVERHGRVDILCNNAGVGLLKSVTETEREEYDRVLDTNLWGLFTCSRHAIPHMVAGGGGSVVNIGSVAATVGFATDAAYCASKGAVHALTRQMALDYAQHGVRVNCVAPGLHRDRAGAGLPRQPRRPGRGRAGDGRRCTRWAAWADPRRSPRSSRSSPRTTPRS